MNNNFIQFISPSQWNHLIKLTSHPSSCQQSSLNIFRVAHGDDHTLFDGLATPILESDEKCITLVKLKIKINSAFMEATNSLQIWILS